MVVKMITSKNGTKYLNSLNGNRFVVGVFTSFITVAGSNSLQMNGT